MTIPTVPSASPLTEADFLAVRQAEQRHRAIKRAGRIAAVSAVSTLGFAAIGVIITIFDFTLWSLVITVGLAVIGGVEFRAHQKLLLAEPAACRTLALNQLAFFALITVYCLWQMFTFSARDMPSGLRQLLDPDMLRNLPKFVCAFYAAVILGSAAFQGGLALYYHTRRRQVEAFVRETPDWVRRQLLELDR
jgi:Trk-type K+ transport system membrane component